ncbi:hypothetical protein FE394_16745 [Xenorhabdus sp. Reich]|uniref:Bacteriophage protein n=1 Tax=Xenorhabdus littoralis TaxID=2582835 RepID=A0ABU4SQ57_9GAMM|nr:DUF6453 family protein [Xenorhabdus sp. Reich]MDX8000791.1 hypothetical protein [Xenorhabdus sp. Reich]
MSDTLGIMVRPGDGGKPYYLDSDRAQMLSLLRTVAIDGWDGKNYYYKKSFHIPEARNFNIVLIPIKTVMVGQQGLQSIIRDRRIERMSMDGEYLNIELNETLYDFAAFSERERSFYIQVCGDPKHTESFGIKLAGMNGVSTIADQNRLGYCVYRGRFSLGKDGQWRVPDSIPNRSQCLVFARTETPGAAIGMTHDKVIVNNEVACEVHVVIFSSGFPLQKPDWGVAIYNASGHLTYSSYYTPFFLGEMIPVRDGRGAARTIARPMIHVNRLAKLVKNVQGNSWRFADSGFKFSGNTISISEAGKMDFEYFQADHFSYQPINYDIYAINFDDYF